MATKHNNATPNRPDGERLLDAPLVRMNIPDAVRQIRREPAWTHGDRNAITLLHNDNLRLVLIALHQNAAMPTHTVDGPSCIQLLEGRIWLETDEYSITLDGGDAVALQPQIPHMIHAEEESVLLLTLSGSSEGTF